MLHQFEEHSWNGFKNYVNNEVFKVSVGDFPLNDKNIFWINIPIVWILMPIFAGLSSINVVFGLWIIYFSVFNSLSHVFVSIRNREYNPGLIVSLILGIPIGTYALIVFYSYITVPVIITVSSVLFALLLHLIIVAYIGMNYKKNLVK